MIDIMSRYVVHAVWKYGLSTEIMLSVKHFYSIYFIFEENRCTELCATSQKKMRGKIIF